MIDIVIAKNKLNKYENYLNIIKNLITNIDNHILEEKKNYKHNPLCINSDIQHIEFKNEQLHIKYKNNQTTILFNLNENYRSFSLCQYPYEHVELIKKQLNCQIVLINTFIDTINNIIIQINKNKLSFIEKNKLSFIEKYNLYNLDYNLDDILKTKIHTNKKNYDYYLSICPIYSFLLKKNKIYIANQYHLKFENGKFNIFYNYNSCNNFKILLNRPLIKFFC